MLFKNNSETLILIEFRCKQMHLGGRNEDMVPRRMTEMYIMYIMYTCSNAVWVALLRLQPELEVV